MRRILRAVVLTAALISSLAAMSSSAGAVTWHNSGDTAFTATGGAGTFSSTSVSLTCSGSTSTGTVPATPFVGATWTAMTITTSYSGCLVSGNNWPWECSRTFTATAQPVAGQTSGTMDTTCRIYLAGVQICHASGTQAATYTDPIAPSTFGRLNLQTGGTIRIFNGAASCPLGNGDLVHFSPTVHTVSAATGGPSPNHGPIITRTA